MKILHLTLASDAGGLSQYILTLGRAMRALGHEITVAGDRGAWQWAFDDSPLDYLHAPLKGGYFDFRRSAAILRKFVCEHPVDVIHTHYRRATLLGRKLQSRTAHHFHDAVGDSKSAREHAGIQRLAFVKSPPVLYTLHLSHISLKFPRSLFTDFGDYTHVASEDARRWLVDDAHLDPARIQYIPHGVDVSRFSVTTRAQREDAREKLQLGNRDTVALFVGRLDYPKNEEWLIHLASATRQTIPNLKIIFIGEGPHEAMLKQRVIDAELDGRVSIVGYQDPLPYYRAADAILLPSLREGFSLVCAEAMATGVTALRTRTSGVSELIVENVTGRSTPIDHDEFLNTAVDFLTDPEALRRMGIAAAEHIRSRFTFDQQLSRTIDLYRSIAKVN